MVADLSALTGRTDAIRAHISRLLHSRLVIDKVSTTMPTRSLQTAIPAEYAGWWRIVDTSTWLKDDLDILGPALVSFTGSDDALRMHCLLAHVNVKATRTGVSFTWSGAWEYDQASGTGTARLAKDGRLRGRIKIKDGDDSTFVAERASAPLRPIPDPPSYRDKWRR
jgi:hypothetical protein